jgi:hypothetical protein
MTEFSESNAPRRWWRVALAAAAMAVVAVSSSTVASAHESRAVGPYTFIIGFRSEPAFEDVVNAAEIIILRGGQPVSTSAGDLVDLTLEVQLRQNEAFDAPIVQAAALAAPAQGFNTPGRYYSNFKPTVDGTYAFRIRGLVSTAAAGQVNVDETFVCGLGSLAAGAFNCVRDPQTFPTGASDEHGRDRHGYIDDDSLRPFRHSDD